MLAWYYDQLVAFFQDADFLPKIYAGLLELGPHWALRRIAGAPRTSANPSRSTPYSLADPPTRPLPQPSPLPSAGWSPTPHTASSTSIRLRTIPGRRRCRSRPSAPP
ncbi:MAG: hypothetical protein RIT45_1587 [Pseudomonadota bacterium]|jgi:hypothetical protein